MPITGQTTIFNALPPYPYHIKIGRNFRAAVAQKKNASGRRPRRQPALQLRLSNTVLLLARSAVAVFGLGFIDAGYSGDWSRIGVISKESEDLLKISAFLVVPLCLFLIFSILKEKDD